MSLARKASVVGLMTLGSRVIGLVREAVIAARFGASWQTDALFIAITIPATLRRFLAEGAVASAFVPVFTDTLEKQGESEARRFARAAFSFALLALPFIVGALVLFAPQVIWLFAHGFTGDAQKLQLTILLARINFVFLFFVSLAAIAASVLNSLKIFAIPAATPMLHNLAVIGGALLPATLFDDPITGVAVGFSFGGLLMLLLQLPTLRRRGYLQAPTSALLPPPMRRFLKLLGPAVLGVGVYQINMLVARLLASFLPDASLSYLWYADRLHQLPLGVFAVAVATVSLTSLSEQAARDDREAVIATFGRATRMVLFVTLPSMAGLAVLAEPLCALLFQRGAFSAADTVATARVLLCFLVGLWALSGSRVAVAVFHAHKDTRTPVLIAVVNLIAYALTALLLMGPFGAAGLALAASASAILGYAFMLILLRRRMGPLGGGPLLSGALRHGLNAGIMAAGCHFALRGVCAALSLDPTQSSGPVLLLLVGGTVALGVVLYAGVGLVLGGEEMRQLLAALRRRVSK